MDYMEILQSVFMAASTAVIGYLVWVRQEIRSETKAAQRSSESNEGLTRLAMQSLLRSEMWSIYTDSLEHGGTISQMDRDHFCDLFDVYSKLGGNGSAARIYDKVLKMPDRY